MKAPVSEATRAKWRKQRDFVLRFGRRYLSERERVIVTEVDRQLTAREDLAFTDSTALGRIHAQMQERIG